MKISAVVKCHLLDQELWDMTRLAVSTIKPYVDELILIDHASDVGGGWLRSEADIYHRFDKPLGFPMTASKGMELATGDYVAILNNDIKFFGDWVTPLVGLFGDDVAIVHPKMLDWGAEPKTMNSVSEPESPERGLYFSAFMLNPKIYNEVGGWDTEYDYWGYDDWDYYYRVKKAGYKTLWTERVVYWHKGGATISRIGRDQFKEKNRTLFERKHGVDPHEVAWNMIGVDYHPRKDLS